MQNYIFYIEKLFCIAAISYSHIMKAMFCIVKILASDRSNAIKPEIYS